MLISLFKYHWWRSRVSSISHCHRLSTPCASSFSSLPDETLFLPLLLPPPPHAKKAVSPTSRVESSPTVSPGRFLYFPVFLPRLLLGPVNYEEGEGHEIRAGGFISPRVSPFLPTFTGARADFSIASKGTRPGEKGKRLEMNLNWIFIIVCWRDRERGSSVSRIFQDFLFLFSVWISFVTSSPPVDRGN